VILVLSNAPDSKSWREIAHTIGGTQDKQLLVPYNFSHLLDRDIRNKIICGVLCNFLIPSVQDRIQKIVLIDVFRDSPDNHVELDTLEEIKKEIEEYFQITVDCRGIIVKILREGSNYSFTQLTTVTI